MTSTLPAALVIGMAQHTTRGTSRPFVPIIDEIEGFCGDGVRVQEERRIVVDPVALLGLQ